MLRYHANYEQFCELKRLNPLPLKHMQECIRIMKLEHWKNKTLPKCLIEYAEEDLARLD